MVTGALVAVLWHGVGKIFNGQPESFRLPPRCIELASVDVVVP